MKKIIQWIIFSLLFAMSCSSNNKGENNQNEKISVSVEKVSVDTTSSGISFSGNVTALTQSTLSTRIMGQVEKVYVNTGDKVRKGQLLVKIKNNDIIAQSRKIEERIIEAQSAFSNAETNFNRIKKLYEKESVTRREFDDSKTNYDIMKARLNSAKYGKTEINEMLSYTNIRAPYSGIVVGKFVYGGDLAAPGTKLIAIEIPSDYEVIINVPESQISSIKKNDKVKVYINSLQITLNGVISRVSPSSKFSGSQYEVHSNLKAEKEVLKKLKTGMFVNVILPGSSDNKRILIPKNIIINKGQLYGVWTVSKSNTALLRWIRVGKEFGDKIEVISGLREGDYYIIPKEIRLYNGAPLTII